MPGILADSPDPSCSHLHFQDGIQEPQPLGIDLSALRARVRVSHLLPPLALLRAAAPFCRALTILAMLVLPAYAAGGGGRLPVIGC